MVTEIRGSKQGEAIHPLPHSPALQSLDQYMGELQQAKLIVEVEVRQFTYSLKCFKMCSDFSVQREDPSKNTMYPVPL